MTTGPGGKAIGYTHDFGLGASDADLRDLVVPFLRNGIQAGEPGVAVLRRSSVASVAAELEQLDGVKVLFAEDVAVRPAGALMQMTRVCKDVFTSGVERVRVVHEVPHEGPPAVWAEWCRYEAGVNRLLAGLPVWGRCLYDGRAASAQVVEDLHSTHPYVTTPGGASETNPRYRDPEEFIRARAAPPPDPVESGRPTLELTDPTPAAARGAIARIAREVALAEDVVTALVTAVNEVVTNASVHGVAPVRLRAWTDGSRVVATVEDQGEGPPDPFAGLAPTDKADGLGGFGLWIAHQLMPVLHRRTGHSHTVQLATSLPAAA